MKGERKYLFLDSYDMGNLQEELDFLTKMFERPSVADMQEGLNF